jgi:HAD superfamily hydrolase (TIGR01459 family)
MTHPQALSGLAEVADRYDVLLCDVWGVIHNGRERFPAACAALQRFRAERGPVILISNAPRPSPDVQSQLAELEVPRDAWTAFITSGDATRTLLSARAPGPAWHIGPERHDVLYDGLGLTFAGPSDAAFIACSGPVHDEVETPEDYRADLSVAADRGLTMVCANPDRLVHRGEQLIYCAGALADLYVQLGGDVVMAGKPYPAIYDLCLAEARARTGQAEPRVLCIGDGIPTDVQGAAAQGLDCLFIAGGLHGLETADTAGALDETKVASLLAEARTHAAYVMKTLSW